jgi:hypothetical protein
MLVNRGHVRPRSAKRSGSDPVPVRLVEVLSGCLRRAGVVTFNWGGGKSGTAARDRS